MKLWITFDGRVVTLEEMEHQHMSNIYWFITKILPNKYSDYIRQDIMLWLKKRFNGLILYYQPHPDFKKEINYLLRKGYLKPDGMIVVDNQVIGCYEGNFEKKENVLIPSDAHSFEVFAIKDCEDSPTGKQAFIGFKLANGNFDYIGVPFTEPLIK